MGEQRKEMGEGAFPSEISEEKQKLEEAVDELRTISQIVGGDFGMNVSLGKEGEGSYFNPPENKIVFDPLAIKDNPDYAKFVAGHEGSHRAISAGSKELGLTKAQEREFFGNIGFRYMNNAVEDPAVNDWLKGRFPGFENLMNKKYDRELEKDDATMVSPEVARLAEQTGKMPLFAQYGTELMRDWHKGKVSETVDPMVKKALDRTLDDARKNIKNIPDPSSHSRQETREAAQKRFETNVNYLWPEVKKLVEKDLHNEELRNSANDYQKAEEEMEKVEQQEKQSGDTSEQSGEKSEQQGQQSEQQKQQSGSSGNQSDKSEGQQGNSSEQKSGQSSGSQSGKPESKSGARTGNETDQSAGGPSESAESQSGGASEQPSGDASEEAGREKRKEQIRKKLEETGRLPEELREELKQKMNEAKEKAERSLKEEIEKKEKELSEANGNKKDGDSKNENGEETQDSGSNGVSENKEEAEDSKNEKSTKPTDSEENSSDNGEKEKSKSGSDGEKPANEQNQEQNGQGQSAEEREAENKKESAGEETESGTGEGEEEKNVEEKKEGSEKSEGENKKEKGSSESEDKKTKETPSPANAEGDKPSSAPAAAGEEKPVNDALSEKIKKEIEKLKNELEKIQSGEKQKPLPLDELSEELKKELEKQLAKRSKEEREKYKKNAERAMEDFEDELNKELEGKLNEDMPEKHAERRKREEEEAKSGKQPPRQNTGASESGEMTKKDLNINAIKVEKLKVNLTKYEKMRKDVAPLADALYLRLVNDILKPEDYGNDEAGYSTGLWPDFTKVMQADHSKDEKNKLWYRETFPGKKDYRFDHLVDVSGSMDGEKMEETLKGGIVVIEPIDRLQDLDPSKITVRQSVAAFHNKYFPIKGTDERMTEKIEKKFASIVDLPKQEDSGTNTFEALKRTLAELLKDPGENGSFVFVYTDGAPNEDIREELKTLLKGGKKERNARKIKIGIIWLGQTDDDEEMKELRDEYGFDFGVAMAAVKPSEEERRAGKTNFAEKLGGLLESIVKNPDTY